MKWGDNIWLDNHLPLYFLFMFFFVKVAGTSDFAIRYPSAVWGVLLVILLYAAGRKLISKRVGILTAFIAALAGLLFGLAGATRLLTLTLAPILGLYLLWASSKADVFSSGLRWRRVWGGSAWGPRFLVPLAAPLTLLILPAFEQTHRHPGASIALGAVFVLSVGVQLLGTAVNFLHYGASLVALDQRAEWTLAVHDIRYQPIWGHLRFLRPEHLDLAWVRPTGERFVVDGWMLGTNLVLLIACAIALWAFERRGRLPGVLPLMVMMCVGVILFGQVRLYHALIDSPGVRLWQSLYDRLATEASPGDVLFVQDSFGSQLSYSLDKSRVTRYHWSPRAIPLDDTSVEWVSRFARPRTWFASGVPAVLDSARGIERWLADLSLCICSTPTGRSIAR